MTTVLLDTHVVHWWSSEPARVSPAATAAIEAADELAVSAITWFELAWLAQNSRIVISMPIDAWLQRLAEQVRTAGITSAIAVTAVSLPSSFPRDPADRLIYATAVEMGWSLVSRDERMRAHSENRGTTIW